LTVERQNEHLGGKRKRKTISGAYWPSHCSWCRDTTLILRKFSPGRW
jgi:hypothetical protein